MHNMKKSDTNEVPQLSGFPVGNAMPEMFSAYFTGKAYLAALTRMKELNCPVSNVTFEPCCRNNWHSHTGGQLLIAVGGRGLYQEKGQPARELKAGDIVEIAPNVIHWHGAAPDSWFSHLAIATNPAANLNTWLERVSDEEYREAAKGSIPSPRQNAECPLEVTDKDFVEIIHNFVDETTHYSHLIDGKTAHLLVLASAIAQNAAGEVRRQVEQALTAGATPIEIREVIYQGSAYTGAARIPEMIAAANEVFTAQGIALPLSSQATVTADNRFERGLALQKEIFGGAIDKMRVAAPENEKQFQDYLSANCFGDWQTRTGLDKRMREMITFAMLISLGGCEPQVRGHIRGNLAVGNDKELLLQVITLLVPYIGYPRTLNAVQALNDEQ